MGDWKWTKGPWVPQYTRNIHKVRFYWLVEGKLSIGTENEADAHLVAAAPDLYATLLAIGRQIDAHEEWWMSEPNRGGFDLEAIDALLAKARGEA